MLRKPAVAYATLVLCLIAAASFFVVDNALAQDAGPIATVLVARLNVRAGPGTNYAVLGQASAKDVLKVAGQAQNCSRSRNQSSNNHGATGVRTACRTSGSYGNTHNCAYASSHPDAGR